jgi:cytochrome c553
MLSRINRILFVVLGLGVISAGQAELTETEQLLADMAMIKGNKYLLESALESGKERSILCGNCHGKDGNSVREHIPNLASQNAAYLFNQFELFATGERKDYVMSRLAKSFSRDDKVNIALYFSAMPVKKREQPVPATAEGEKIYQGFCFTCHQKDGHGDGSYPRIAGQPYEFLLKTLNGFAGADEDRKNSPMTVIISNMNEKQIKEVAAYVASMP